MMSKLPYRHLRRIQVRRDPVGPGARRMRDDLVPVVFGVHDERVLASITAEREPRRELGVLFERPDPVRELDPGA